MKKLLFLVFTFSLFSTGFTQSLEEVLQNHFKTIGQEKLTAVSGYIARAKFHRWVNQCP